MDMTLTMQNKRQTQQYNGNLMLETLVVTEHILKQNNLKFCGVPEGTNELISFMEQGEGIAPVIMEKTQSESSRRQGPCASWRHLQIRGLKIKFYKRHMLRVIPFRAHWILIFPDISIEALEKKKELTIIITKLLAASLKLWIDNSIENPTEIPMWFLLCQPWRKCPFIALGPPSGASARRREVLLWFPSSSHKEQHSSWAEPFTFNLWTTPAEFPVRHQTWLMLQKTNWPHVNWSRQNILSLSKTEYKSMTANYTSHRSCSQATYYKQQTKLTEEYWENTWNSPVYSSEVISIRLRSFKLVTHWY